MDTMPRIRLMQNWFGYSDPATEEALYEVAPLHRSAGLLFGRHQLHMAIIELLEPTFCLVEPELIDLPGRKRIEALKELVRELRTARGGEA